MALIRCPECGAENISDSAKTCPRCGYKISAKFKKEKRANFFKKPIVIILTCIVLVIFILFQMASYGRQTRYGNFSGEYYASGNGIGPAVIHFDDDGTGHYYIGGHMYLFDYSLYGGTISIDTHEEFLPTLKGEIDIEGTYDDDSITFGNVVYHKKTVTRNPYE